MGLAEGRRFDCGNKLGYLIATVEYALVPEFNTAEETVPDNVIPLSPRQGEARYDHH